MTTHCMSRTCAKFTFWICAAILVVSVAILIAFPSIYKSQLKKQISLTDGSLMTGIWEDIPLPLHEKLYFFNITNGDEFLANKAPLNVSQVGPYTYKGKWTKNHPRWNNNGTVSYRELRTYHFVPELSSGSENDYIYTLNGPLIIAADILKGFNIVERIAASLFLGLKKEKVIIRKTVGQLGYGGYEDPIIKLAPLFKKNLPFKDGRFLWLVDKNFTDDGLFTVFTGEDDYTRTGLIEKWNGESNLTFWKGPTCNELKGTSIETGPALPETPTDYTFFQSLFCRSVSLKYNGNVDHFGIKTKRFISTDEIFANGTVNEDNWCYDIEGPKPSGVLNLRPCQFDAPVLLSFPHFHMADPSYLANIIGLQPETDLHGSHLDVEPVTGISLDAAVRFQLNLQMSRVRGIVQVDRVPEGVFPVLWVAIEIHVSEDWANYLNRHLNGPKIIFYTLVGIIIGIATAFLIWSLVVLRKTGDDDDHDPLIAVKEEHKENLGQRTLCVNAVEQSHHEPEEVNHTQEPSSKISDF